MIWFCNIGSLGENSIFKITWLAIFQTTFWGTLVSWFSNMRVFLGPIFLFPFVPSYNEMSEKKWVPDIQKKI